MSGRAFWSYLQSLVTVLWIQVCHRCAGSNCIRILTCLQKPHFVLPFQEILLPAAEILTVAAPWSSPPVTASSYRAPAASTRAMLFSHLKKLDVRKTRNPSCPVSNLVLSSYFCTARYYHDEMMSMMSFLRFYLEEKTKVILRESQRSKSSSCSSCSSWEHHKAHVRSFFALEYASKLKQNTK